MTKDKDVSSLEVEALVFELEQAREDDRDAWARTWQAIVAGVTAMAIVLAFYAQMMTNGGGGSSAPSGPSVPPVVFLILALLITIATFSYVASIAVLSALRYRYMRELESRLMELSEGDLIRWTHLAAPVDTLNVGHIRSVFSASYYMNLALGVSAAGGFCLVTTVLFFRDVLTDPLAIVAMTVFAFATVVFVGTVVLASSHTEDMYSFAKSRARERMNAASRGAVQSTWTGRRHVGWAIAYYVYPRPMDALKVLFVVLGVVLGCIGSGARDPSRIASCGLLGVFVFDVLVYQARYQWNDVRGAVEDLDNPRADLRCRLPTDILGLRPAVIISVVSALFKIVLAVELSVLCANMLGHDFLSLCCAAFVLAAVYEWARERKGKVLPLFLVTLGYPLRVWAGMSVGLAAGGTPSCLCLPMECVVALVSSASFGLAFVGMTWALEGSDHLRKARERGEPCREDRKYKPHVMWVCDQLGSAKMSDLPLSSGDRGCTVWGVGMGLSLASTLSCVLLMSGFSLSAAAVSALLAFVFAATTWTDGEHRACVGLIIALLAMTSVALISGRSSIMGGPYCAVLMFSEAVYLLVYLLFRRMNYRQMAGALVDALAAVARLVAWMRGAVLGTATAKQIDASS